MKRKNTLKSIIALTLCVIIALTTANTQTTFAATKKHAMKIGFNGKNGMKTATVIKDLSKEGTGATIKL